MKIPIAKHPGTDQNDYVTTTTCAVMLICAIKFFLEGISISLGGHTLSFGHGDASTYAAILTPILGAHGVKEFRRDRQPKHTPKPDNPDA